MKEISIITLEHVDKTFEGTNCYLKRTIISSIKENGEKRIVIRTQRCVYVDVQQQVFNEDHEPVLDDNNNRVFEGVKALKVIGLKEPDFVERLGFSKIDDIYRSIKSQVSLGDSLMEFEQKSEQLALLKLTKDANAWGIPADKWTLL